MRLPSAPAILTTLGFVLTLLWGVYIFAGLAMGGYGPHARRELLVAAVAPPALASLLVLAAGAILLRRTDGSRMGRYVLAAVDILAGLGIGALAIWLYDAGR